MYERGTLVTFTIENCCENTLLSAGLRIRVGAWLGSLLEWAFFLPNYIADLFCPNSIVRGESKQQIGHVSSTLPMLYPPSYLGVKVGDVVFTRFKFANFSK